MDILKESILVDLCTVDPTEFTVVMPDSSIYRISEGEGVNLLVEDREAGYVDYIYYDQLDKDGNEIDGGLLLLKKLYQDMFKCAKDVVEYMIGALFMERASITTDKIRVYRSI